MRDKGILSIGNRKCKCSTFHLRALGGEIMLRSECGLHHEGPCQPTESLDQGILVEDDMFRSVL